MNELLLNCEGFDWDEGNSEKNWILHQVARSECEQAFFNEPLIVADDTKHSQIEKRWFVLCKTDTKRLLFMIFTIRNKLIRIISARDKRKYIMSKHKNIPKFKNEDEERKFWAKADSSEYIDWRKAEKVTLSKLKPSTKTISLRLPEFILDEIKMIANKKDVPYQSLIKIFLKDRIDRELKHSVK